MRCISRWFAFLAVAMAMSALGAPSIAGDAVAAPGPTGDSYYVIGVKHGNLMLQVTEAKMTGDGKINKLTNRFPPHMYRPDEHGFIVVKAKPGASYVIESASVMMGNSPFGMRYTSDGALMAFDVPPGAVVYVADLDASAGPASPFPGHYTLNERYSQDVEGAKAYLITNRPELAGRLTTGHSKMADWD